MSDFNKVVQEIFRITNNVERKSTQELALKTGEEVGELQQAVLSVTDAPGCGYKGKTWDDVEEEVVDVVICALAVAFKGGTLPGHLLPIFERKMAKWMEKLG
jgi:NTP pyrophosphatase (non-canonical NTP hydrolase)